MAPTFLKELRRRSRASFRTEHSTDTSSEGVVNSTGSTTPPSIAQQSDPALNLQLNKDASAVQTQPQRSPKPTSSAPNSRRNSVSGMSDLGSPGASSRQHLPLSPYAPRVLNVSDNAWVYQKTLLVYGTIGETVQHSLDGTVVITRLDDSFPPTSWPVCGSHFKALVYLQPGPNKLKFEFNSPKLPKNTSNNIHVSHLAVHMIPPLDTPPLQLAIVLGRDSPGTFDSVPSKVAKEGNGLETAIRKYRMAAHLWQSFTAEQMWRHKLGRRSFRFEEEWTSGTSNQRDRENGTMRSEARIHIIRSERTVAEIRALSQANGGQALFNIAADAVKQHLQPLEGQRNLVSALLLDAQWNNTTRTVAGHVSAGGSAGDLQLAVFGSQYLYSYPTAFEEVVPAFTDCTPTNSAHVANSDNQAGSSWEAANIGIGEHLQQVGRLLGCPNQDSGIMLNDYVVFNRTFVVREAYSTRTKSKGGIALQGDECGWHRLDCLRFRAHPAFRLPGDAPLNSDDSVQAFVVDGGNVIGMAATGISFVEIFSDDDGICHAWIEYASDNSPVHRQVTLTEQDLRARLPERQRKGRLRVVIHSLGDSSVTIDDFKKFTSKSSMVKLSNGKGAFRSRALGDKTHESTQPTDVVFSSAGKGSRILARVAVYYGPTVEGLELFYDDDSTQLFGKKAARACADVFEFDRRRGEYISGFIIRSGVGIESIQILTSLGRRSPAYGNPYGGSSHTMIPPRGYTICGVSGSCGSRLESFSVLITR